MYCSLMFLFHNKLTNSTLSHNFSDKGTPNAETTIVSIDINYGAT